MQPSSHTTFQLASAFLQEHPMEFTPCLDALRKLFTKAFYSLVPEGNPVVTQKDHYTHQQLAFIITEYAGFSQEAIHMLLDAMLRNHDWKDLFLEIQHNIDEEKGSETRNIPHLEMMRQGYRHELGIETDGVSYSGITKHFLKTMRRLFNHDDNAYSSGALLAFEGTAIPEFQILDVLVRSYEKLKGLDALDKPVSLTRMYILGHKEFEIGHEAHLAEAIAPYITPDNIGKLVRGYLDVCGTMHAWWLQLAEESWKQRLHGMLEVKNTEHFDISGIFRK